MWPPSGSRAWPAGGELGERLQGGVRGAAPGLPDRVQCVDVGGLAGEEGTPAERLGYSGGHGISGHWGRYVLFSLATNSDGTPEDGEEEGSENDADGATELRDISEGFFDQLHGTLSEERA